MKRKLVIITLPRDRYPFSCQHILEARMNGHPSILEIDRIYIHVKTRRQQSLHGYPTINGMDRDEYPLAMSRQGGLGADVKYIPSSDNRGAGAYISHQLRPYPNGTLFYIKIS